MERHKKQRLICVGLLMCAGIFLSYYWQVRRGEETLYTHFFYVPIALSSLWFGTWGVATGIFSALIINMALYLAGRELFNLNVLIRSFSLIFVGAVTSFLSNKIIKKNEEINTILDYYLTIFEVQNIGIVLLSENLEIKKANRYFETLSGYKRHDLENKLSILSFFPYEDKCKIIESHNSLLKDEKPTSQNLVVSFRDKDNKIMDVILNLTKVPTSQDVICSILDVTNEKELLQINIELLRLQKLSSDVNYACMISTNEAGLYNNVLKLMSEQLDAKCVFLAKKDTKVSHNWTIHAKVGEANIRALENVINDTKFQMALGDNPKVYVFNLLDGNALTDLLRLHGAALGYKSLTVIPMVSDGIRMLLGILNGPKIKFDKELLDLYLQIGQAILVRSIMLNVRAQRDHALQELEKERIYLRKTLDFVVDPLVILKKDFSIEWCNKNAKELFGLDVGYTCYSTLKGKQSSCEDCPLHDVILEKKMLDFKLEYKGTSYWVSASPLLSDKKDLLGVILLFRDLKAHGMLQAETVRVAHLISIGELAAGVAHEINNPLNGIINLAQMLLDMGECTKESQAYLQKIISEGVRASSIVHNLLAFARSKEKEAQPHNIESILKECLDLMWSQFVKDGVSVELDVEAALPKVKIIKNELKQVILNILSNSRYAVNKRFNAMISAKKIVIRVHRLNDEFIRMSIWDNGIGIPKEVIDRVFDPFFTTKPPGEGTGLGLSISFGIVKKYGGEIYIDSIPNEYTEVKIDLPIFKGEPNGGEKQDPCS